MKAKDQQKYGLKSAEVQVVRGTSFFRHIQISWQLSEDFGLTVSHLRCGLCLAPLESHAIKLGKEIFLVCEGSHLIGNELVPEQASAKSAVIRKQYEKEVQEKKRKCAQEYQDLLADVMTGRKSAQEFREWESDVPSRETLPRFSNHHEYNLTLERLIREFRESNFQKQQKEHIKR